MFEAEEAALPSFVQNIVFNNTLISSSKTKLELLEQTVKNSNFYDRSLVLAHSLEALLAGAGKNPSRLNNDDQAKLFMDATSIVLNNSSASTVAVHKTIQSIVAHFKTLPVRSIQNHLIRVVKFVRPSNTLQRDSLLKLAQSVEDAEQKKELIQWAHQYPEFLVQAFRGFSAASDDKKSQIIDDLDNFIIKHEMENRLLGYRKFVKESPQLFKNSEDLEALMLYLEQFVSELND